MKYNHQYSSFEKDAMGHMQNKLAPSLKPSSEITGNFSVRVLAADGTFARIELMIVDVKDHNKVLHSFGIKDTLVGKPVTLEGLESTINFLPKGV